MFVFIMRLSDLMCMYLLQKTVKIFLLSPKCSFFFRRRGVSVIYFWASNGFKMADSLISPVKAGQPHSDSSSSSSDSLSLSSDSSSLSSDSLKSSHDSDVEEIEKMDELKVMEHASS